MEKEISNINVKLNLKINGMTIDEFQKEIEKLSSLLAEMKQLSIFRDVKRAEFEADPYWEILNTELSIGKGEGTD